MAKKGELKSLWLIPGAFVFFVALGILFSDQEKPQSQTDRFAEQERLRLVEGAERKKAEEAAPAAFRNQSYTALDANGRPTTPSSGERPHACVRDNTTGLIWEVKTDDGGLRDKDHTYSWYDSKSSDGNPGSANGGMCYRAGRCDTQKYVQDVNAMGLCGYRDWRMPTIDELKGLVVKGREPTIDDLFFPNTPSSYVWSGSPDAGSTSDAWFLNFAYGNAGYNFRSSYQQVRLVRGGQ